MKVREVIRLIEQDGWFLAATRGAPAIQTSDEAGAFTVAGKASDDMAPGTLNGVLKQAQLKGQK